MACAESSGCEAIEARIEAGPAEALVKPAVKSATTRVPGITLQADNSAVASTLTPRAPTLTPRTPRIQDDGTRICKGLLELGFPYGLSRFVGEEDRTIALRVFVLDNSGSTAAPDGAFLDTQAKGGMAMLSCSRWEVIKRTAIQQAIMNAKIGTPCEFVLLNPPKRHGDEAFQEGVHFAIVDPSRGDLEEQLMVLEKMLNRARLIDRTSLGQRLSEVHERVKQHFSRISAKGLRCIVAVFTDGLPACTGGTETADIVKNLVILEVRRLTHELNCFVVMRLVTRERKVVEYFRRLEGEQDLDLKVVSDFESEARDMQRHGNSWLTYSPFLHAVREGGTFTRHLDALKERALEPLEVQALAGRLMRLPEDDEPLPGDSIDFFQVVRMRLREMQEVYDPLRRRMVPCIMEGQLRTVLQVPWTSLLFRRCWSRHRDALLPLLDG
jgi:hypothetical protein